MPWLQLRVYTQRQQAEAIEDALLAAGAASVTLEDDANQPILEPDLGTTPVWDATRITGLFDADIDTAIADRQAELALGAPLPEHRWEQLEDKDWEREWMKSYQPIHCGNELWICPSWIDPPEPNAVNLLLDPGLAFGTGTHPTTFQCLKWLSEQTLDGQTVIDYGCGSGILGIAALLLGAGSATGTDIDHQALTASRDNALRNCIDPARFPVFLPKHCEAEPADLMLANILAGPLAELAGSLASFTKLGGQLCLSGILQHQAEATMAAYRPWFDFEPVRQLDEWVCLTAVKVRD